MKNLKKSRQWKRLVKLGRVTPPTNKGLPRTKAWRDRLSAAAYQAHERQYQEVVKTYSCRILESMDLWYCTLEAEVGEKQAKKMFEEMKPAYLMLRNLNQKAVQQTRD